jgi:hypothetical protein
MASALASSNSKRFWQQVNYVNKPKKSSLVSSVDGVSGSHNISHLFSEKLRGTLNSHDSCNLDALRSSLLSSLSAQDIEDVCITEECVAEAFSRLKFGKSDGTALLSDHLIHALPAVCSSIASLFTAILKAWLHAQAFKRLHSSSCTKGKQGPGCLG